MTYTYVVLRGIETNLGNLNELLKDTGLIEFTIFFLLNGQLLLPSPSLLALKCCENLHLVLWSL